MKWEVKTDYSGLAPYEKIAGTAVRLHSGPLTELLPSGDYGLLLPYASAANCCLPAITACSCHTRARLSRNPGFCR